MHPFFDKDSKLNIVEYGENAVQVKFFDRLKKTLRAYITNISGKNKAN